MWLTFINDTCMVKNTENENKICKNLKSNFRSSNASRVVKKRMKKICHHKKWDAIFISIKITTFLSRKPVLGRILWGLFLSRVMNVSIGFNMCRIVVFVLKKMIILTCFFSLGMQLTISLLSTVTNKPDPTRNMTTTFTTLHEKIPNFFSLHYLLLCLHN